MGALRRSPGRWITAAMKDLLITTADALRKDAADVLTDKRMELEKLVDALLKRPRGPERWKEALKLYISFNMSTTPGLSALGEYMNVKKDNEKLRDLQANKFATSEDANTDLRYQLNMPAGAHHMISLVDPDAFKKENIEKMRKTFPEFVIAESF